METHSAPCRGVPEPFHIKAQRERPGHNEHQNFIANPGEGRTMISERTRSTLLQGASKDEDGATIFAEDGNGSVVFRLFRAGEGTGDPEQLAISGGWAELKACTGPPQGNSGPP